MRVTNYYPRFLREYEARHASLGRALLINHPQVIFEVLMAELSIETIDKLLSRSRFRAPGIYRSTTKRLKKIADERKAEQLR
jgi:hypothetical protein